MERGGFEDFSNHGSEESGWNDKGFYDFPGNIKKIKKIGSHKLVTIQSGISFNLIRKEYWSCV